MEGKRTEVAWAARYVGPVVLGVLLLAYVLDAFLTPDPWGASIYSGLVVVSLFLVVVLAGLFIQGYIGRRPLWRTWLIELVAAIAITVIGWGLHSLLGQPTPAPTALLSALAS